MTASLQSQPARVGALGIDSVALVDTDAKAKGIADAGASFAVQYLGSVTRAGIETIVGAGLGFMPVTYADRFDPIATVNQLRTLDLPKCTVWLDIEGQALSTIPAPLLKDKINAWSVAVAVAGFEPGMYVGPGCPLTSVELYQLRVVRYWHCGARIVDRNGQIAEPGCGWCMYQLFPSVTFAGVWSDINVVQEDFRGRLPTWVIAGVGSGG